MATRKWQAFRRRRYRTRAVDVRTRPANLARSTTAAATTDAPRDSQAFHATTIVDDHGYPLISVGEPER